MIIPPRLYVLRLARLSQFRAISPILGLVIGIGAFVFVTVGEHGSPSDALPRTVLTIETARGAVHLSVEVATTKEQQERGLMFRKLLAPDSGMLFDFTVEKQVAFWMKDTLIPLDMVFLRSNGSIARIAANTKPLSLDIIQSRVPVRAVLEIAAGSAMELGIRPGERVEHAIFGNPAK